MLSSWQKQSRSNEAFGLAAATPFRGDPSLDAPLFAKLRHSQRHDFSCRVKRSLLEIIDRTRFDPQSIGCRCSAPIICKLVVLGQDARIKSKQISKVKAPECTLQRRDASQLSTEVHTVHAS